MEKFGKSCSVWIVILTLTVSYYAGPGFAQTFQCQSSSDQSGLVYTPNIPDLYFNDTNAASFRRNNELVDSENSITYFFTIPAESASRNCSGAVISIQYCYRARFSDINQDRDVFNFLAVNRSGLQFRITSRTTIQITPQSSRCTNPPGNIQQVCCDTTSLSQSGLQIPSSEYTFGIVITNDDVRPLAFANSNTEYRVEQFRSSLGNNGPAPGSTITLTDGTRDTDRALLLIRFNIEPEEPTVPPTTAPTASPTTASTTPPTTALTAQPTTAPPTTAPTAPPTTAPTAPPTTAPTPFQQTTGSPPTMPDPLNTDPFSSEGTGIGVIGGNVGSGNNIVPALGGVIGGCMVLFIIMAVIVVVVVVLVRNKKFKRHREVARDHNPAMGIENAIYGTGKTNTYADVGPHTKEESFIKGKDIQDIHEYYYAECGASYEVPSTVDDPKGMPSLSAAWKDEDIYMVPENDENLLYAQLEDIKIIDIHRNSVQLSGLLGSGQFGTVYKGVLESDGNEVEVAVKTLKEGSGEENRVKFLQEAAIMGQFKHHNVVNMYGVVTDGEPILLVLELLTKGDLRDHLNHMRLDEEGGGVSVDAHTLLSYCRQVASGMAYLSNKAFVHRDLAARNILVSEDEICKIADFGMSRELMEENYYVSHGGKIPVKWTAPEAIHYKKYSTASDVWSYGALMYEIWSTGRKPYETVTNNKVIKLVDTGYRLAPPPGCPRAIYDVMIKCWHSVASQRPSFSKITQLLSHPDPKLLKWSDEDKSVHPEATRLGADLLCAEELYKDLQTTYMTRR